MKQSEITQVRRELAEALRRERAQLEMAREQYPQIKAAMDRYTNAIHRARALRTQIATAPIRKWDMGREPAFEKVAPVRRTSSYMHIEWQAICLNGEKPSSEAVAELAAMAYSSVHSTRMLAAMAYLVMPVRYFPSEELPADAKVMAWLLSPDTRPLDLATLINGAMVAEFAAAHIEGAVYAGRLLAIAALLWWAAGQPWRASRAAMVSQRLTPGWELTDTMVRVLYYRGKPEWMTE
ncbi:hypothetical protein [uncultured Brachybacterium sp.]|uniref:hypothetical protein n=1 Tax=uncultured Brachybacterium sp. TaxID=189680 RepID=UPI002619ECBC|nr:hypothetical protein [uncultured Brachybacterium sp.]